MKETQFEKAKRLSIEWHESVNQTYGGKPYTFHLDMVEAFGETYLPFTSFKDNEIEDVKSALRLHDTIEDAQKTFNDIKEEFGYGVANIVWNVSGFGKNRSERNMDMYMKSANHLPSIFVKVCDHFANFTNSLKNGHKMANVYQSEYPVFRAMLYKRGYIFVDMWRDLDELHQFSQNMPKNIVV